MTRNRFSLAPGPEEHSEEIDTGLEEIGGLQEQDMAKINGLTPAHSHGGASSSPMGIRNLLNEQGPSTGQQYGANHTKSGQPAKIRPKLSNEAKKQIAIDNIRANTGTDDISTLFGVDVRPRFKSGLANNIVSMRENGNWHSGPDAPVTMYSLKLLQSLERLSVQMKTKEEQTKAIEAVLRHRMERHKTHNNPVHGVDPIDVDSALKELSTPPTSQGPSEVRPQLTDRSRGRRADENPSTAGGALNSIKRPLRRNDHPPGHYAKGNQRPHTAVRQKIAPLPDFALPRRNATVESVPDVEDDNAGGEYVGVRDVGQQGERQGANGGPGRHQNPNNVHGRQQNPNDVQEGREDPNNDPGESDESGHEHDEARRNDNGRDGDRYDDPTSSGDSRSTTESIGYQAPHQINLPVGGAAGAVAQELRRQRQIVALTPTPALLPTMDSFAAAYGYFVFSAEMSRRYERERQRERDLHDERRRQRHIERQREQQQRMEQEEYEQGNGQQNRKRRPRNGGRQRE